MIRRIYFSTKIANFPRITIFFYYINLLHIGTNMRNMALIY